MTKSKVTLFLVAALSVGAVSTVTLPVTTHNNKSIILQSNRTVKNNSVSISSYSLSNKTVKGTITIAKSLNLKNPNNGISIGTNPNNPGLMNREFNLNITSQSGKVYNLNNFTGVLPAGTYSYNLSNVPENESYVTFELMYDGGNIANYTALLPYQLITNLQVNSYKLSTNIAKVSFDLETPLNLNNPNNGLSIGTNENNPQLMNKEFNQTLTYENGKVYNINNSFGVLPAGQYTLTLKDIPSNAKTVSVAIFDNGQFLIYSAKLPQPLVTNFKISNYNSSNGTAEASFHLVKPLDLGIFNNGITLGPKVNNPALMNKEFNAKIVYQNGTVYNLMTYTGILPVGNYKAILSNIPKGTKVATLSLINNLNILNFNSNL